MLQFDGAALLALRGTLPEMGDLQRLFEQARRGLEFTGATAVQAARLLEEIGPAQGLERLILFLQLVNTLMKAPAQEVRLLASTGMHRPWMRAVPNGSTRRSTIC